MSKKILYFLFFWVVSINAQSSWKKMESKNTAPEKKLFFRKTNPKNYNIYTLDTDTFSEQLAKNKTISIPINDKDVNFTIKESSSFSKQTAAKYGNIKSYSIYGIDDKTASGKITTGLDGIHVIIFSSKQPTYYIDTYSKDKQEYIAYNKSELQNNENTFECLTENYTKTAENTKSNSSQKTMATTNARTGSNNLLRTYRIALACTGEYAQYHINRSDLSNTASDTEKKAVVLSAMNTTMSRINGVFEKDLGVKMEIVINNDGENELIFLDGETDNLSNNNASALITESQNICDNIIGSNNYDIGHTFSQGEDSNGLAILGAVCDNNGYKAQGVTIRPQPIGDSFDIDFVAHEIGHQFGANHTFNYLCSENQRNNNTAVEVGSGSTIMAYAGACSDYNIQNNSDDYFHSVSIFQMLDHIENTSCATTASSSNAIPTANAGQNVVVPKSTPLVLKGEAIDSDNDALTYCWEQIDTDIILMPLISTNLAGPTFRSLSPSNSPNRYLPNLATVISGSTANEWEVIPSVARTMNFSLLVRDNNTNGGAISRDDISITILDIDPFTITSQNNTTEWEVGSNQTITWDKSNTDEAPINCENVTIKLSTDGGQTFPITLVENTPNDGNYTFVVPNETSSTARVIVEAIDNIFYNVNSSNISIINSEPTFILSNLSEAQEFCKNETSSIRYTVDVNYINGFNEDLSFSLENLPEGVTASLSSSTINTSKNITITLNNFTNTDIGNYTVSLKCLSASSVEKTIELPTLSVRSNSFETINSILPVNNSEISSIQNFTFEWTHSSDLNISLYNFQLAEDENFNSIIVSEENLIPNIYTLSTALNWNNTYYWRVQPKNNCFAGDYSSTFSFTPVNNDYCSSTFTAIDVNKEYISNVKIGTIDNNSGADENGYGNYSNLSTTLVLELDYLLEIALEPLGFRDHVYVFIDWNNDYYFDPSLERYDLGEHTGETAIASTYITVPENAYIGDIRMRVIIEYFEELLPYGSGACDEDHNDAEFGETEDYTLKIIEYPQIIDNAFDNFSLFPNPTDSNISLFFTIPNSNELITVNLFDSVGRLVTSNLYKSSTSTFNQSFNIENLSSGIYFLHIQNGDIHTTKKIIKK